MCNTKQNGTNIKSTAKMALRVRKTINQERNTPTIPKLYEKNEKSLIVTIRKL